MWNLGAIDAMQKPCCFEFCFKDGLVAVEIMHFDTVYLYALEVKIL